MKSNLLNMKQERLPTVLDCCFRIELCMAACHLSHTGDRFWNDPCPNALPSDCCSGFCILAKEGFRNVGWGLGKWWYVFPAVLVPLGVAFAIVLLLRSMNWATLSDTIFVFQDGMLTHSRIGLMLGNQPQSIPFFVLNFVLSHAVFLIIGSIVSLGEEFGWRGYLQEKICRDTVLNWGLVILGIVWGYGHLPIVLMGWSFPNHPVLGALVLFPISTIFLGVFS